MKSLFFLFGIFVVGLTQMSCESNSSAKKDPNFKGNGKRIVVDVRTQEEWDNDGHSNCAVHIPLDELEGHESNLAQYDTVIFVCRSGGRAGLASDWLAGKNFGNLIQNGGTWSDIACPEEH